MATPEIIGVTVGVVVVIICAISVWYLYKMRKGRSGYDQTSDHEDIEIMEPHDRGTNDNDDDDGGYDEEADGMKETRSSPKATNGTFEAIGGEEETLMDEGHFEIEQWFLENVQLNREDIAKYAEMFIQNGYNVVCAFRYIDKSELDMMGIDRRSHQTAILNAIKRYNGDD